MSVGTGPRKGDKAWPARLPKAGERLTVSTHSADETIDFGRALAQQLTPPLLVVLEGELGSGKTTFTKGVVSGMGAARESEVTSPSFTLVHEYGDDGRVAHLDLYRVESLQEFSTLGLEELLDRGMIVLVEWGEKLGGYLGGSMLRIRFEYAGEDARKIEVEYVQG